MQNFQTEIMLFPVILTNEKLYFLSNDIFLRTNIDIIQPGTIFELNEEHWLPIVLGNAVIINEF